MGTYDLVTLGLWSQDEEVVEKERQLAAAAAASRSKVPMPPPASKTLATSLLTQVKKYVAPVLRVDPSNRCAALMTFDAFLNIFDLTSGAAVTPTTNDDTPVATCQTGISSSATGASSFYAQAQACFSTADGVGALPSLASPSTYSLLALGLGSITDMQFLHGFADPTLLILHERRRTWEGRYAAARLTQELSCVTFHLQTQSFSLIGSLSGVAHDAFAVHPIPMPLGGALILQPSLLAHWNNNALDYALAVNEHGSNAARTDKMPHTDPAAHVTNLDRAKLTFLSVHIDRAVALLATAEGLAFLLTVLPSGASVRSMQLDALGLLPAPTGLVHLANPAAVRAAMTSQPSTNAHNTAAACLASFVFAYSRTGPALLLEYRRAQEEDRREQQQEEAQELAADAQEKREAAEAAAQANAIKVEQEKAVAAAAASNDNDLAPIPSIAAQLDAAGTDEPAGASAGGDSKIASDDGDGAPPAKRSRLDEMYKEMTGEDMADDELMDVFGFGRAGETKKEEEAAAAAAKPVVLDEAKQAEVAVAQAAADRETARRERISRALRTRKDLLFFVRDRLACSAPASDLTLGYALPRSEEEARDEAEFEQALADETAQRNEKEEPKPTNAEEERALAEREIRTMIELEKKWREKDRKSRVVEFVQLAGHADSGAVTVATEGIMPDVITASPLQRKCVGCWTLKQSAATGTSKKRRRNAEEPFHALLLISTPSTTLVIQTGAEIQELTDGHPFEKTRTITAANVYASKRKSDHADADVEDVEGIVQVYRTGMRLIQNGALETELLVPASPEGTPLFIDAAQIESPHVLLRLSDGSVRLFIVEAAIATGKLALVGDWQPAVNQSGQAIEATSVCLFKDASQARTLKNLRATGAAASTEDSNGVQGMETDEVDALLSGSNGTASGSGATSTAPAAMDDLDDLERLLGGDDAPVAPVVTAAKPTKSTAAPIVPADHYLVVAHDARLEFYALPERTLVYAVKRFPVGKRLLEHADLAQPDDVGALGLAARDLPHVVDLCVANLSSASSDEGGLPVLFALLDNGDLLAYQAFVALGPQRLKWSRVDAPTFTRPFLNTKSTLGVGAASTDAKANTIKTYRDAFGIAPSTSRGVVTSRFQRFSALGGSKSGILVTGTKPFLFLLERGRLRYHAFIVDARPRAEEESALGGGGALSHFDEEEDVEADEEDLATDADEGEQLAPETKRKQGLLAATPFHHPSCAHGLIYFDSHGTLHMATLPTAAKLPFHPLHMSSRKMRRLGLISPLVSSLASHSSLSSAVSVSPLMADYDAPLVTRTVHLGATPVFLARHTPTSTTVVVLAHPHRIPSLELESDRTLPQYEQRYEVLVFSSSWEVLARYTDFEPHEMVLCMAPIRMNKKVYIVLGTSEFQGEDHSSRGRIILLDLYFGIGNASTLDASGQQQQVKLLKLKVYTQAEKLPVNCVAQLAHNVLVTGQGSKLILYKHNGKQLHGCAFFDGQMYLTSIACINHFILYGDIRRGIHLLYWDPILKTLTQLGMSNESFHVTACEFLVDAKNLNLVAADEQSNLQMFKFAPNTPSAAANKVQLASYENPHVAHRPASTQTLKETTFTGTSLLGGLGYKLNLKNDFHIGERIASMIKLKLRTRGAGAVGAGAASKTARQLVQSYLMMSSYGGAYSQLLPVDQLVFRRLSTLVLQMSTTLPQAAGLNPLAYRLFQASGPYHPHFAKKVLDATLLYQYTQLDADQQWQLAAQIGTTPAQIIENIKGIAWATQCH